MGPWEVFERVGSVCCQDFLFGSVGEDIYEITFALCVSCSRLGAGGGFGGFQWIGVLGFLLF